MAGLPEPGAAYALLIGVSEFEDSSAYKPLPSTHASVTKLAALLKAEESGHTMWRLPQDRIKVLGPEVTADEARKALQYAVSMKNLDALLVCISCHGHRYPDDGHHRPGLHLAMTSSIRDIPGSHWHFDEVRNSLELAAAKVRHILLIVDACWADGTSVEPGQGSGDTAQVDHLAVPGAVVLTATRYRVMAWPHWRGTGLTAFLGALIESIEGGVSGPVETLTAMDVFDQASSCLDAARHDNRQIPEPWVRRSGRSDVPLCRNQRYIRPVQVAEGELGEVTGFPDAEACFTAIKVRHRDGRDELIRGIVEHFCSSKALTEDDVAGLVQMLRASEFSGYLGHAYDAACAERSASEIAAFADRLHRHGVPIGSEILSSLRMRQHAGRVVLDVYQAMLKGGCPDCAEAAEALSAQVVDDPALSAEALAVWQ